MKKEKLCILITSLSGGGAERVTSILIYGLRDFYDITLVTINDIIDYDIPKIDIEIINLKNFGGNSRLMKLLLLPYYGWQYKNLCVRNKTVASLSLMYRPNFINIFAKFFGLKSKIILSERNTPSQVYKSKFLGFNLGLFLIQWLYPKADKIIANSKGNSFDLIDNFAIPEYKLVTIYNPVELQKVIELGEEEICIEKGNDYVFLMTGRFEEHKRQMLVIETFARLNQNNAQLWLLGKGPLREEIESLIIKLKLEDKVKILGFDVNPFKFMTKCDCFISASTREGFPNALVEALACGLPIISSDCPSGPREILAPNSDFKRKIVNEIEVSEFGILFPTDNSFLLLQSMQIIQKDINPKNKLTKIKKRIEEFSSEVILQKYKEVLSIRGR